MSNEPIADDWIQTYTGKRFYPLDPIPNDIDINDIAHALSLLCRYGGHVDKFYSVAEHCIHLSNWVDRESALAALLHDATEAYVVDVPRPIKYLLPDYREVEDRAWLAITSRFDIDLLLPDQVKEGDNRILINEKLRLMPRAERWEVERLAPLPIKIKSWGPKEAEQRYIERFRELYYD